MRHADQAGAATTLRGARAVLFDYGLTLVHFDRPVEAIVAAQAEIARCIADAGHRAPTAAVLQVAVHDRVEAEVAAHEASGALEEIDVAALQRRAFADLGLDLDGVVLDRCSALVQEAWWRGARLYADAADMLRTLRRGGLRLAVCSNAPYRPASMHGQLTHLGLHELLDAAVFSGEVGWRKPSPRLFAAALDAVATRPEDAVFVGDRPHEDVNGAAAVGMRTVLVARDALMHKKMDCSADAVIHSLAELPALLLDETQL